MFSIPACQVETIAVSGYADDTAIYLRHQGDLPYVLQFFKAFEYVFQDLLSTKPSPLSSCLGDMKPWLLSTRTAATLVYKLAKLMQLSLTGINVFSQYGHDLHWRARRRILSFRERSSQDIAGRKKNTIQRQHKLIKDFVWGCGTGSEPGPEFQKNKLNYR
ncbi:hypothetical protein CCR75_003159 [Bremia lactucae]|uniref:Uncharacterized protein n=1 Tax=Bremia lactucae TaxID=4779 RepID=A0A976IIG3_BRELC|nr:hypothetical protein CCR75_003159 [Bremia lactucae]